MSIIKKCIKDTKIQKFVSRKILWTEANYYITTWEMIKEATKMIWR